MFHIFKVVSEMRNKKEYKLVLDLKFASSLLSIQYNRVDKLNELKFRNFSAFIDIFRLIFSRLDLA